MEKRKIYLSGKITGDEGFAEKFKAKEEELSSRGDYVFNPALHPDMFTHDQFMQIDLLALSFCDSIYLMNNWRDLKGAKMEFEQAKVLGLDVEFEKEPYILLGAVGYYSDKSDEFDIFNYNDISADDMFDTKEAAEQAMKRLLHKEAGNVTVLPASEVFGNEKDVSFEQTIKNEKDISKIQNALQNALEKTAVPFDRIEPRTEETGWCFYAYGTLETPKGTSKLSKADLEKFSNDKKFLNAVAETLLNPSVILEKETFDEKNEYFKPIEVFEKPFVDSNGKIKPIVLYRDGINVSVGTALTDIKKFVSQIKTAEQLTYIDKTVGQVASLIIKEEKNMENTKKEITTKELQSYIKNLKIKHPSKWAEAVKEDAADLVGNYIEWNGEDAPFKAENVKDLLDGAENWKQYSYGGLGLIYDTDIAMHYSTSAELKKLGFKEGNGIIRNPNARETWLDVQARALFQASELIKKSVHDIEMKREKGVEQKSPEKIKAKSKEDDFGIGR